MQDCKKNKKKLQLLYNVNDSIISLQRRTPGLILFRWLSQWPQGGSNTSVIRPAWACLWEFLFGSQESK